MQKPELADIEPLNPQSPSKPEPSNKTVEKYTAYVLKRLQKILTKSIERWFFSNLRTHVYNIVKQSKKPLWKYHKLFLKSLPTEEQQMFKQFLNHCAVRIQCFYKMFGKRREFTTTKRIYNNLTKWVRGKKVRAVYNCKKLKQIRSRFQETNRKLDAAAKNCQPMGNLMKQSNYLIKTFNQQYQNLYETGEWIYQVEHKQVVKPTFPRQEVDRPIKAANKSSVTMDKGGSVKIKEISKVHDPMPDQNLVVSEYMSRVPQKPDHSNKQIKNKSELLDERPIKGAETYNFDAQPLPISRKPEKVEDETGNENNPQEQNPPDRPKHKRLVRKEVYDPKKAIASQNRKKKQLLKTQGNQEAKDAKEMKQEKQPEVPRQPKLPIKKDQPPVTIDTSLQKTPIASKKYLKQGIKNVRQRNTRRSQKPENKSIQNISAIKQTKSRVDCWNKSSVDLKKKREIEDAYYEEANDIESYDIDSLRNVPRERIKEHIAREINKINENIKCLRINKKRKQKNEDPDITILERVYEDQYSRRYMQLKPKLDKLCKQRNCTSMKSIPYLLRQSQYAIEASNSVSTEQYYQMEKEIIINYQKLKRQ